MSIFLPGNMFDLRDLIKDLRFRCSNQDRAEREFNLIDKLASEIVSERGEDGLRDVTSWALKAYKVDPEVVQETNLAEAQRQAAEDQAAMEQRRAS